MLRHRIIHILVALTFLGVFASEAATRTWEPLKTERTDTRLAARQGEVEIRFTRGVITVSTPRPVQIKVFTILGQLVSADTLPAGTSQLTVSSHGVYIVKTPDLTCKVAL